MINKFFLLFLHIVFVVFGLSAYKQEDFDRAKNLSEKIGCGYAATKEEANLAGVNLSCAPLAQFCLSGVNLTDANLAGADLSGARLNSTVLRRANLTKAKLMGAKLRYARLDYANLTEADFSHANLYEAILVETTVTNSIWTGANLLNVTIWNCFDRPV